MNADWIEFLNSNNATITEYSEITFTEKPQDKADLITAIAHLTILQVSGQDAAQFLQGQLTCDINEITESNSFFSAFCNAKGRTISTLLILKNTDTFLIILPEELTQKVINKLKMYILRSDVAINIVSNLFCMIGVNTTTPDLLTSLPTDQFTVTNKTEIVIKFPSNNNRYLIICSLPRAKTLWSQLTKNYQLSPCSSNYWRYQDISAGIPWLSVATSEDYIPQMLNIDKLGGISFKKGCYTGQEIIARTHYLGKAKRELFLAECAKTALLDDNTTIFKDDKEQVLGKIISIQANNDNYRMLLIMATTDAGLQGLKLNNPTQDEINIIDFQ